MSTEKNKTNENCNDKCENAIPDKELINKNDVVENNENNVIENVISESTDEFVECGDYEILMCVRELERESGKIM